MLNKQTTINCKGHVINLEKPIVMGILNTTPDSFYDGNKYQTTSQALRQAEKMLAEGATIIDIGGMSSRPGAHTINEKEELNRVLPIIKAISKQLPEAIISIDTIHAQVARQSIANGASLVNDISAGRIDKHMYPTIASLEVPYILMHMQGQPNNMQQTPTYQNPTQDILDFLITEVGKLKALGIKDIIIDPGFGFGKTIAHNYQILNNLHTFQILGLPILAGLSRKSMVYKPLHIQPTEALNGTTALHMVALQQGANILRAHDVKEAVQTIQLWQLLQN